MVHPFTRQLQREFVSVENKNILFDLVREFNADARFLIECMSIPEPNSGCWLWLGIQNPYGRLKYRGMNFLAHHMSFMAHFNQRILEAQVICHRCDTPACVNPNHLFIGTQKDNIIDAIKKGRVVVPERTDTPKYSKETKDQMREDFRNGMRVSDIVRKYKIPRSTVNKIVSKYKKPPRFKKVDTIPEETKIYIRKSCETIKR